jgi:crotonobetainyl-CoA:carnitine CoA-transferase CaiB-like acyl-CoA transferase
VAAAGADEPRYVPTAMADRVTGLFLVQAISAALFARERTGRGQSIAVPMFESLVHFLFADHLGGATFDPPIGEPGYARMLAHHRMPYRTLDGHLCVLVYNDAHWRAFFRLLGDEQRFDRDPMFANQTARSAHIDEVYRFVAAQMATRTTAEWLVALRQADIPAAAMSSVADVLADPHLAAVGLFGSVDHPSEGRLRDIRLPSTWSATPPSRRRHAPRLGEHSVEVLREAGIEAALVDRLVETGVVRQAGAVHPAGVASPSG